MNILNGQNLFDVAGKVVLVTGAATGLGEGYAHIFAESGCKVACADIPSCICRPDSALYLRFFSFLSFLNESGRDLSADIEM